MQTATEPAARRRVVIIGGGFGGLAAAKGLADAPVDITVIDRHNYHLFQPLLYQVATAGLSPADIASPIRGILRGQPNARAILGHVSGVDTGAKTVSVEGRAVPYDDLIIASGARHAYFGHDEWAEHAPGLKTIDDATYLRRRILLAFEKAEAETDLDERRALLTFVVVGGGPTGVEMAGAIAELAKKALARDFRTIDPREARVILIESGGRVLAPFDPALSAAAKRSLEHIGVEVRLGKAVTACEGHCVMIGEETIPTRTMVWAAGVRASRAGKWLKAETDRAGRVIVAPDLTAPGHADIFVIGDTACVTGANGKPLPGVAPVAKQQGQYVAAAIKGRLRGETPAPFRYRDFGSMATIGRRSAVAQFGKVKISGQTAWLLWGLAHVYFLIGFRNRIAVVTNWLWHYVTFQSGTRLITGMSGADMDEMAPPPAAAALSPAKSAGPE